VVNGYGWKMSDIRDTWFIIGIIGTRTRDDWDSQELVFNKLKEHWVKRHNGIEKAKKQDTPAILI